MILIENLTKKFGENLAVEGLSLEVKEGEVFGFLGPNGAGKTTTVRMLTSLIRPTSGKAVVNGFTVGQQDTQIRRSVGLLTETPGLYDNLSAEYNLRIYANLYEVKDVAGQVEKYLRLLGAVGAAVRAGCHALQGYEAKAGHRPRHAARAAHPVPGRADLGAGP